jgi:CRISPR-associated protein Cmr2
MAGDGMGARVEGQATSAANLGLFSQRLGEAMERAVLETLVRLLPPIEHDEWPFQVVYIGGDDLFLLVPAARALDVSRAIAQRFEQLMAEYALTVSAGVVMCHPHYPIYFLHRMAKALCASAKRSGGCRVDFEILRSGAVANTDPAELRKRLTSVIGGGTGRVERRSLTMRPYTWSDLDRLLDVYRDLRSADYPKGQLISMASEALKSRLEGSSLYVYQVARAQREERAALTRVSSELSASAPPPWRVRELDARGDVRRLDYCTMLGDLVEMYGVVAEVRPVDTPCD